MLIRILKSFLVWLLEPRSLTWTRSTDMYRTKKPSNLHDICITSDGRNLHDEEYCDVTGYDARQDRVLF